LHLTTEPPLSFELQWGYRFSGGWNDVPHPPISLAPPTDGGGQEEGAINSLCTAVVNGLISFLTRILLVAAQKVLSFVGNIDDLAPKKKYVVRVRAVNEFGASGWSPKSAVFGTVGR
jgi:hypothetical protein